MNTAMLLDSMPFTNARANLSGVFDKLINNEKAAVAISRKNKEEILLMKRETQKTMLTAYQLKGEVYTEADHSYTVSITPLDIAENGDTLEEALNTVIKELKNYAADYIERLPLFMNAPNRRDHLPFVMRIILADDDTELKGFIDLVDAS